MGCLVVPRIAFLLISQPSFLVRLREETKGLLFLLVTLVIPFGWTTSLSLALYDSTQR
jgi:hypothetical protein